MFDLNYYALIWIFMLIVTVPIFIFGIVYLIINREKPIPVKKHIKDLNKLLEMYQNENISREDLLFAEESFEKYFLDFAGRSDEEIEKELEFIKFFALHKEINKAEILAFQKKVMDANPKYKKPVSKALEKALKE